MNDDWDGVDWAEHFSGPDDSEIERSQNHGYGASTADDSDEADHYDSINSRAHRREPRYGTTHPQSSVALTNNAAARPSPNAVERPLHTAIDPLARKVLEYFLDSQVDFYNFEKHAVRQGATVLKAVKSELSADDYDENGVLNDFHLYKVTVEAPANVCLDYYRSGTRYEEGEKERMIDSYLSWMHVDQIAFRHKRTVTAVMSVLTKAGCAFYQREAYKNPDEEYVETEQIETQRNGYQTHRLIIESLSTGRCEALPVKPLELEWIDENAFGFFHIRELSQTDQQKIITFVAGAISLESALILSTRLNQHHLTYCIARQMNRPARGLIALDKGGSTLSKSLQKARKDIEYAFRQEALAAIKTPLAIWFYNKDYRYDNPLFNQSEFETAAKRFFTLYKLSSVSRGFEIPGEISFMVAAISRDYESIELMAQEGNWLAKWHCHEHTRINAMIYSVDQDFPGSDIVRQDQSDRVTFDQVFQRIKDDLPTNWRAARDFNNRRIPQAQLLEKQRREESAQLDRELEESEMNDRINEIDNYYDGLGYRG